METKYFDKIVRIPRYVSMEIKNYIISESTLWVEEVGGSWKKDFEIPKTSKDLEIIECVQNYAKELMIKMGRKKIIDIPISNIHIFKEGGVSEFTDGVLLNGCRAAIYQSILIERVKSDASFASVLFHELMHCMAYNTLFAYANDSVLGLKEYRSGFSCYSSRLDKNCFVNFEEAIINILAEKFIKDCLYKNKLFKKEDLELNFSKLNTREVEKKTMLLLIEDLSKRSGLEADFILNLFIEAHINGNIFPVAKLINNCYGEGYFRILADMTAFYYDE